ncbi:MAG: glycosyltransferase family 2 protein, partial [Desulfobacterales bacterium]|nr:glycosyltransferase family 2 protein [Desulfobacterales bacterium]
MAADSATIFSIIVPAYNEEGNIRRTVAELCRAFSRLPYPFEIIVVNDGSTDRTLEASNGLKAAVEMMTVVNLPNNCGKGYAIRKGVERATGKYVVFMDADLDIQPDRLNHVLKMLQTGTCDIAIGSKRHPESELVYPLFRKIISVVYYGIVQLLFGLNVRDTQAGYKIFKRETLLAILPRVLVKKFAFDLEILVAACRLGYRIREFPIRVNLSDKYGGISLGDIWRTGIDTLAVFYRNRVLDFYGQAVPRNCDYPAVSVIIPVGAASANLERCLAECLNQDYA